MIEDPEQAEKLRITRKKQRELMDKCFAGMAREEIAKKEVKRDPGRKEESSGECGLERVGDEAQEDGHEHQSEARGGDH